MSAPTISGIPTVVGNAGADEAFTTTHMARALGLDVGKMRMQLNNGELPPLPPSTRMFGLELFDIYVARIYIEETVPAHRERARIEREVREQEPPPETGIEVARRAYAADPVNVASAERQRMFQQLQQERAQREADEAAKQAAKPAPIILKGVA